MNNLSADLRDGFCWMAIILLLVVSFAGLI